MTEGHVELVLDYCTHYWNGETPCKLTSKVRWVAPVRALHDAEN